MLRRRRLPNKSVRQCGTSQRYEKWLRQAARTRVTRRVFGAGKEQPIFRMAEYSLRSLTLRGDRRAVEFQSPDR
jgi:hypothetical protein